MATTKTAKVEAEIEKTKAKITELQAKLKELELRKVELENSEIVRSMSISLDELPVLLQTIRDKGALGQIVPKSEPVEMEGSE